MCACNVQVIGVIDVDRSKEKGYETIVKEGFCDEVGYAAAVTCGFNIFPALVLASSFSLWHYECNLVCLAGWTEADIWGIARISGRGSLTSDFSQLKPLAVEVKAARYWIWY